MQNKNNTFLKTNDTITKKEKLTNGGDLFRKSQDQ